MGSLSQTMKLYLVNAVDYILTRSGFDAKPLKHFDADRDLT